MRIRKVKYKESEGMVVEYEKPRPDAIEPDYYTIKCKDEPHPDLVKALQKMVAHALDIAEMHDKGIEKYKVLGCTFTYTNDVEGLVITITRELNGSNSPMCINTPHFTREPYSDTDSDMNIFSMACGDDMDLLKREAKAYIEGKRNQAELDFGGQKAAS